MDQNQPWLLICSHFGSGGAKITGSLRLEKSLKALESDPEAASGVLQGLGVWAGGSVCSAAFPAAQHRYNCCAIHIPGSSMAVCFPCRPCLGTSLQDLEPPRPALPPSVPPRAGASSVTNLSLVQTLPACKPFPLSFLPSGLGTGKNVGFPSFKSVLCEPHTAESRC